MIASSGQLRLRRVDRVDGADLVRERVARHIEPEAAARRMKPAFVVHATRLNSD